MSNYSSLKATINANVKANGNQEITGPVMNSVLNAMVDSLGAGYQYMGKAVPSTNPGTPDAKVFYLASDPGTYTNFNGLVVADGEVAFLKWDSAWIKEVTGAATAAQVTQLGQQRNLSDAVLAIRAKTSSYSVVDNPSGTRIRIIIPVRKGEVVKYSTSLSSGINGAIYDSIPNAIYSSSTVGKLQGLNSGYSTTPITVTALYDGYAVFSLTNVSTAISDTRKAEMLAATSIELSYNPGKAVDEADDAIVTFAGEAILDPRKAWYNIRVRAGNNSLADETSGNRLRVIQPVKPGDVIWAYSTDAGGVSAGIWDTPENVANAGATGMVEWIISGYTTGELFHVVKTAGYAGLSLTNGSTAISDARKSEMLDSMQVFIGSVGTFMEKMLPVALAYTQRSDKYSLMSGNYVGERPALGKYHVIDYGALNTFSGTQPTTIALQGMGVAYPYLFWGSESGTTRKIVVLNMDTRSILGTMTWTEEGTWHMNNINVSTQRYSSTDKFPLIYLSECAGNHRCAVVRIADDAASYSVIQMLTFADASTYFLGSQDWFLDEPDNAIYAFGTSIDGSTSFKVVKFSLPALTSSEVNLSSSDVVDSFDIPDVYTFQGSVVINGRLYIPYGYGRSDSLCRMKIVDLAKKETVTSIPLYKVFGNVEIEGVSPFEDGILVSSYGANGRLYKIVFD